eukprot:1150460-Pelagomonas_calceolata.AAC.1
MLLQIRGCAFLARHLSQTFATSCPSSTLCTGPSSAHIKATNKGKRKDSLGKPHLQGAGYEAKVRCAGIAWAGGPAH